MASRESNQVLVRLFHRAEALAKMGDRPFLEGDDRGHGEKDTPGAVKILLNA
jgi:hypothetical protein